MPTLKRVLVARPCFICFIPHTLPSLLQEFDICELSVPYPSVSCLPVSSTNGNLVGRRGQEPRHVSLSHHSFCLWKENPEPELLKHPSCPCHSCLGGIDTSCSLQVPLLCHLGGSHLNNVFSAIHSPWFKSSELFLFFCLHSWTKQFHS